MTKHFPIFLFIFSIIFLVLGVTKPLMDIEATVEKKEMLGLAAGMLVLPDQSNNFLHSVLQSVVKKINIEGTALIFKSTRSLLGTMTELVTHGHIITGLLIGLFGVLIPLIKILLTISSLLLKPSQVSIQLLKLSNLLGKWSMSDVFTMAIIVTFLAINTNEYAVNSVQMSAELGPGFYFFMTYCLLAIGAGQLLEFQWGKDNKNSSLERK